MEAKTLGIEPRTERGKNESRRLRREGFIPAILYSHGKSESVKIAQKDFYKLFKGRITESVIFDLKESKGGDAAGKMAYVKDYQMHPATGEILHVDLFKVTKDEKIHTRVPLEFIGIAKGIKMGGILEVEAREVEVECLPMDLPEKIQLDVTELDTGDSLHISDIVLGPGIRILGSPETAIASVIIPKVAVIEEKVEEAVVAEGEEGVAEKAAEDEDKKAEDKSDKKAEKKSKE